MSEKCLVGELSGGKADVGELSVGELSGEKKPVGEMTGGRIDRAGKYLSENCPSENCPSRRNALVGELSRSEKCPRPVFNCANISLLHTSYY